MNATALAVHSLVEEFAAIATRGPIAGVLFLIGALLFAVSLGGFGALTVGGILVALRRSRP